MKVTLLAYTPNPADIAEIGAKTCYSSEGPSEIEATEKKTALKKAIESGHGSVLEHAVFTFGIEGISRACSHQLVRHRMASYSQQSQRYVDTGEIWENCIIPESIDDELCSDSSLADLMGDYFTHLELLISELKSRGVPIEDVRYLYPNGITTNIVVTMNARELLHFFSLRCCNRAQWEIRNVANSMLYICKEACPEIFANAGPACVQTGICKEVESCGRVKKVK